MQQYVQTVGLQKKTLRELMPDIGNALVVGIIIAKTTPRKFQDVKNNANNERGVWNFTLRDSLQDYINVTMWNSYDVINEYSNKFQIGDVVDVIKPKIEIRKLNDNSEQYRPMVTSPYNLILSENSQIITHEGPDAAQYYQLIHYPTKPLVGFIKIIDVQRDRVKNEGKFVDILGAVRSTGQIRNVKVRNGLESQVRDVVIFDHTSPGFKFSIWDPDLMIRAESWKPRSTILFLADIKIIWSSFNHSAEGCLNARTIITEDPIGPEAEILRNYAKDAPLQASAILDQMATSIVDPNTIQNVMSIRQVLNKINLLQASAEFSTDQQFTALLYAFVSHFDLDGPVNTVSAKCSNCYGFLETTTTHCSKPECGNTYQKPVINFNLRMTLSDHTGTLENCRLNNNAAVNILNCPVEEFLLMNDQQKCSLKWKFLLERCAVRIMVFFMNNRRPMVSVLSCAVASSTEAANRLPQY